MHIFISLFFLLAVNFWQCVNIAGLVNFWLIEREVDGYALLIAVGTYGWLSNQWASIFCWRKMQKKTQRKAKGKCRGQSAGSVRVCRLSLLQLRSFHLPVSVFQRQPCSHMRPHWRVEALRRLQVKSPFVAFLAVKKDSRQDEGDFFFHLFPEACAGGDFIVSGIVFSSFRLRSHHQFSHTCGRIAERHFS